MLDDKFWEDKHQHREKWWISGSPIVSVLKSHNLKISELKDKSILEVGVGTGSFSRLINKITKINYGCDISTTALNNVNSFCTEVFLSKNLSDIPKVDVAISHLVFQHCEDSEVLRILNEINIKDSGFFSFEFTGLLNNEITNKKRQLRLIEQGSHFFRSEDQMKILISKSNKTIYKIEKPKMLYKHRLVSYFYKVKNK